MSAKLTSHANLSLTKNLINILSKTESSTPKEVSCWGFKFIVLHLGATPIVALTALADVIMHLAMAIFKLFTGLVIKLSNSDEMSKHYNWTWNCMVDHLEQAGVSIAAIFVNLISGPTTVTEDFFSQSFQEDNYRTVQGDNNTTINGSDEDHIPVSDPQHKSAVDQPKPKPKTKTARELQEALDAQAVQDYLDQAEKEEKEAGIRAVEEVQAYVKKRGKEEEKEKAYQKSLKEESTQMLTSFEEQKRKQQEELMNYEKEVYDALDLFAAAEISDDPLCFQTKAGKSTPSQVVFPETDLDLWHDSDSLFRIIQNWLVKLLS